MQARAFIACILDKNPEAVYEGHVFQVEDCAAAMENMFLAITALDYASVWIGACAGITRLVRQPYFHINGVDEVVV